MGKTNTVTKDKAHYRVMAVLSFFMTFFSFLMICAAVVQFTVLNPQFFTSVVKSSGYLQSCQEILEETFASYGAASNFDAEVFGKSRDEIADILAKNDIFARKYFYPLTSKFTVYKDKFNIQDTPVAKDVSLNILTLPLYADLAIEDVEKICEIIIRSR